MKLKLLIITPWTILALLALLALGRASSSFVFAGGPAESTARAEPTATPGPMTPDIMRAHMDAVMGGGAFDRMMAQMGADADAHLAACAAAMQTTGAEGSMMRDGMAPMMGGSMSGMMAAPGAMPGGMMGR